MLEKLAIEMKIIPLPFRLNHVNCFIAEGSRGPLIIDTGLHDKAAISIWDDVLQQHEITDIIVTHIHPDHCGYASVLQERTGAEIMMTEIDAKAYDHIWTESAIPQLEKDYIAADVPTDITKGVIEITKKFVPYVSPRPKVQHYLQEGEFIQIGKEQYEVIATPGHSEGLVVFFNHDQRVLLSSDHILPKITPNISYWFYGEANPLQSYEDSLQKVSDLNADFVIPSHGKPFYDANQRIKEIWDHHLKRFEMILDAIKDGATIFDVCGTLFPFELTTYDYQFAVGETIAHLEYLRAKGECTRVMHKDKWIYK